MVLDDWSRHQLRKEGDVERDGIDIPLGLHVSPADVNRVGQGLEGIEGDAERQDDPGQGELCSGKPDCVLNNEVQVLEDRKDYDERRDGEGSEQARKPLRASFRGYSDPDGPCPDRDYLEEHHREEPRLSPGIENHAHDEEESVSP